MFLGKRNMFQLSYIINPPIPPNWNMMLEIGEIMTCSTVSNISGQLYQKHCMMSLSLDSCCDHKTVTIDICLAQSQSIITSLSERHYSCGEFIINLQISLQITALMWSMWQYLPCQCGDFRYDWSGLVVILLNGRADDIIGVYEPCDVTVFQVRGTLLPELELERWDTKLIESCLNEQECFNTRSFRRNINSSKTTTCTRYKLEAGFARCILRWIRLVRTAKSARLMCSRCPVMYTHSLASGHYVTCEDNSVQSSMYPTISFSPRSWSLATVQYQRSWNHCPLAWGWSCVLRVYRYIF